MIAPCELWWINIGSRLTHSLSSWTVCRKTPFKAIRTVLYGLCLAKKSQNTVCKFSTTTCSVPDARYQLSKSEHARKAKFWDSPARLFSFTFSIYYPFLFFFLPLSSSFFFRWAFTTLASFRWENVSEKLFGS